MSSEDLVKQKVYEHFTEPRYNRYTVKREHPISFGSKTGVADVVLLDSKKQLAAIVECKGIGYENGGIDQLKSYLSASDAPLGVFANSLDPDGWVCYENLKRGQFREISQSRFETRILRMGPIQALGNLLRRIFRRRPPDNAVDSNPPETSPFEHAPYISDDTTGGFSLVPNENRIPGSERVEPSLDGNPYYSEPNGFNRAAYHLGTAACIPTHIDFIIHEEELTHASVPDAVRTEISDRQDTIAKLESEKRLIEEERERKRSDEQLKRRGLRVLEEKLDAPTEAEFEPPENNDQADNLNRKRTWRNYLGWILPALFGLYLIIFYASAIDKAFFLNEEAIRRQILTGEYAGIHDVVNPTAIYEVLKRPPNLLVVLFPIVFLGFAKLAELLLDLIVGWWNEYRTRAIVFLAGLLVLVLGILAFDVILASQISKKIHIARDMISERTGGEDLGPWPIDPINPFTYDLEMMTVIFCGFVSATGYSALWCLTAWKWKQIGVATPDRKQLKVWQHRIDNEKIERKAAIVDLKEEVTNLGEKANRCDVPIGEKTRLIEEHQNAIAALRQSLQKRRIDRTELLRRVSQFMTGWCRYLMQAGKSEDECDNARRIAYETLDRSLEGQYSAE